MATTTSTKSYIIGVLLLIILASAIVINLPDNVKIDIGKSSSTFYVWENNAWVKAGVEKNFLYNGTSKLTTYSSYSTLSYSISDGNTTTTITRTTKYPYRTTKIIDTYTFLGTTNDKELFPISHEIRIIDGVGLKYQYEASGLLYAGEKQAKVYSPQSFGHNMKVEWQEPAHISKIDKLTSGGKLTIAYKVTSKDQTFKIRLFDPEEKNVDKRVQLISKEYWETFDTNSEFQTVVADEESKVTTIGWYLKPGYTCGVNADCGEKVLYDCDTKKPITDGNGKELTIAYSDSASESILDGKSSNGYILDTSYDTELLKSRCIAILPHEDSNNKDATIEVASIYQNETILAYNSGYAAANISLFREDSGVKKAISKGISYTTSTDTIVFKVNDSEVKNGVLSNYTYVIETKSPLVLISLDSNGFRYPIFYNYYKTKDNDWNERRDIYNFKDICTKNYSNCRYEQTSATSGKVDFSSYNIIDPDILNVTGCQTLTNQTVVYTLNQNITNGSEWCIVVLANNIKLDGDNKKYKITGGIYGSNLTLNSANAHAMQNFTLSNIIVDGNITFEGGSWIGAGAGSVYMGNGGNITIINSTVTGYTQTKGGDGGYTDKVGGHAGTVKVINSNLSTLYVHGGYGTGNGVRNGGHVFDVNITNSFISNLTITAGTDNPNPLIGGCYLIGKLYSLSITNSTIGDIFARAGDSYRTFQDGCTGGEWVNEAVFKDSYFTGNFNIRAAISADPVPPCGNGPKYKLINSFINLNPLTVLNATGCKGSSAGYFNFTNSGIENSFGKIRFFHAYSDSAVNLSSVIQITNNSIKLNSAAFSPFNVSSNLTLIGIKTNFNNPWIQEDNYACQDCYNFTSLNAGTVVFNISSFSNYTIKEAAFINVFPPNNYLTGNSSLNFSSDVFEENNITNVSIYYSGSLNQTYTYGSNINSTTVGFVIGLSHGVYNWFFEVNSGIGELIRSITYTLEVDLLPPIINIFYPINSQSSTGVNHINYTIYDDNLDSCWFSNDSGITNQTVNCSNGETNCSIFAETQCDSLNATGSCQWFDGDCIGTTVDDCGFFDETTCTDATPMCQWNFGGCSNTIYGQGGYCFGINSASDCGIWDGDEMGCWMSGYCAFNYGDNRCYPKDCGMFTDDFNCNTYCDIGWQACMEMDASTCDTVWNYYPDAEYGYCIFSPDYCSIVGSQECSTAASSTACTAYGGDCSWHENCEGTTNIFASYFTDAVEGENIWRIYANDSAGNQNFTQVTFGSSFTDTPPQINLTAPANNTVFNNTQNINFNFTATDDDNLSMSCDIYLDGSLNKTNTSVQNATITNFLISSISYGSHNWSINCSDGPLSNVSEIRYFSINDTLRPNIQFVTPTESSGNYFNRNYILINVTASDTNFKNLTIMLYNASHYLINSSNTTTTNIYSNFSNLPDGLYFFNATAYDNAGNSNSTETRNVTIDTILPLINFTNPTDTSGSYVSRNYILTNVTANDTNFANITIDVYNSTGSLINYSSSNDYNFYTNFTGLLDGLYFFNATARDLANNVNYTETRNVTIDTIMPNIEYGNGTAVNYANLSQSNIYINVTYSEINFYSISFNFFNSTQNLIATDSYFIPNYESNLTGLADGIYYYNVTICDLASNCNSTETRIINLDTVFPVINITYPLNNTIYLYNVTDINFSAYDINLKSCWLSTNNGINISEINCSINITGLDSNSKWNNWTIYANDSAGHIANQTVVFYSNKYDPEIYGSWNSSNFTHLDDVVINITYYDRDNETGNISATWYVNGTNVYNHSSSDVLNGSHIQYILDKGNYTYDSNVTVYVNAVDFTGRTAMNVSYTTILYSCNPPTIGTWNLRFDRGCILNSTANYRVRDGDFYCAAPGSLQLSSQLLFNATHPKIYINPGCKLIINSGGKIAKY